MIYKYFVRFNNRQRCYVFASSIDEAKLEALRIKGLEAASSGIVEVTNMDVCWNDVFPINNNSHIHKTV